MDAVRQALPEAGRSSVGRLLVRHGVSRLLRRHGVSRLPTRDQQESGQDDKRGQFKDYPPGFVHIDCFYLPKLAEQKRYCFVAATASSP